MDDTLRFTIGGEKASDYFGVYRDAFPGSTWDGQSLEYENGKYYHRASVYKEFKGLEITVFSICCEKNVMLEEALLHKDVIVVRAAKQVLNYNADKRLVEVGQTEAQGLFMYNNQVSTEICIPKDTHLQMVNMRFTLNSFEEWTRGRLPKLKSYLANIDNVLLYQAMSHKMGVALEKLFSAQELSFGRQGYSFIHSFELLLALLEKLQKRAFGEITQKLTSYDNERMLQVKQDLLDNLSEPPSTEEICDKYGLSAQKLRNDFKTMFGLPPYKFVLHHRFEIAYKALISHEKSIKEVAFDLGFANANHFNKAFTKHFGISAGKVQKGEEI